MHTLKNIFMAILLSSVHLESFAQVQTVQKHDFMAGDGKIMVVMAVVVTIVLGLFLYLYFLDRKITRLEKEKPSR